MAEFISPGPFRFHTRTHMTWHDFLHEALSHGRFPPSPGCYPTATQSRGPRAWPLLIRGPQIIGILKDKLITKAPHPLDPSLVHLPNCSPKELKKGSSNLSLPGSTQPRGLPCIRIKAEIHPEAPEAPAQPSSLIMDTPLQAQEHRAPWHLRAFAQAVPCTMKSLPLLCLEM